MSRICDNSPDFLRKIAEAGGIAFDPGWGQSQPGRKIAADMGDGETAETEEYTICSHGQGDIKTYRVCDNAKEALRQATVEVGFDFDNGWNTREFGNKLIDFINKDDDIDGRAATDWRGLADKLGSEARKMGIPTSKSDIARNILVNHNRRLQPVRLSAPRQHRVSRHPQRTARPGARAEHREPGHRDRPAPRHGLQRHVGDKGGGGSGAPGRSGSANALMKPRDGVAARHLRTKRVPTAPGSIFRKLSGLSFFADDN